MHQIKEMILILGKNMLTLTDVLVLHNFVIKCVSNKKLSAGKSAIFQLLNDQLLSHSRLFAAQLCVNSLFQLRAKSEQPISQYKY